eukprot:Lithocolla_globosa_v1_NODE_414_length_4121_cov_4.552878.p4 type:complete len:100 gc:universal NODE_414_length_4121_cov_4.552878:1152-853(-)
MPVFIIRFYPERKFPELHFLLVSAKLLDELILTQWACAKTNFKFGVCIVQNKGRDSLSYGRFQWLSVAKKNLKQQFLEFRENDLVVQKGIFMCKKRQTQ